MRVREWIFISEELVIVAQWIRPRTLNREVPGSNLLAAAVVPLGKALYILISLKPSPRWKDLKPLVPWLLACL